MSPEFKGREEKEEKQPVMCQSAENTQTLVVSFPNHPQKGLGVAGVSFKKNPLSSRESLWLKFSVEVCRRQNNISCNNSRIKLGNNFHVSFTFYGKVFTVKELYDEGHAIFRLLPLCLTEKKSAVLEDVRSLGGGSFSLAASFLFSMKERKKKKKQVSNTGNSRSPQ